MPVLNPSAIHELAAAPALGAQGWPFVSVIMPVRNERHSIRASLGSVLAQDYPTGRFEVLVADGNSDDGTCQILEEMAAAHPNIILIANPGRIVSTGFNAAMRQACGEIIIRVDGHTLLAPDYVRGCVEALYLYGADNVGGRMAPSAGTPFGQAVCLATSSPFGVGDARFHYSTALEWVDTVYLGAWRREVFYRIGVFDEEMVRNQDDEFNYRLRASGGRVLLSPQIRSTYAVRETPTEVWRQYFQYGVWKVRVLQKHPRQMCSRQFVPTALVLSILLSLFGLPFSLAPLLTIMIVYLLATLAASALLAYRRGFRRLLRLPFVFPILHFGYGLGFLYGLFIFRYRWGDKEGRIPSLLSEETCTPL